MMNGGYLDLGPLSDKQTWDRTVRCPVCVEGGWQEGNFVHPAKVQVDQGGEVVDIAPDGVGFAKRHNDHRGTEIRLDFWCESGHQFRLTLLFHKGCTYVQTSRLPDYDPAGEGIPGLWRD